MSSYERALERMVAAATDWRAHNPRATPVFVFQFPPSVWVAGTIQDGIEQGYVTVNQDAKALVAQLVLAAGDHPTIGMVRAVLDHTGIALWRKK